jgi:hypothetical protein
MSNITQETSPATAHSVPQAEPLVHRIWLQAIVGMGLGVTVAWTCFLGYAVGSLLGLL